MFLDKINEEKEALKQIDEKQHLDEVAPHRKRVVRQGRVVKKKICGPGYRRVGNRCVKMSATERQHRKRAAVHGNRKGKAQRARTRRRSNRVRHNHHI